MTDVELVTFVFDELIAQGGCSVNEKGGCAYRGQKGRKCAIGVLIKDEDYNPSFEGKSSSESKDINSLLESYGLDPEKTDILQFSHDLISTYRIASDEIALLMKIKKFFLSKLKNRKSLLNIGEQEIISVLYD